MIQIWTLISIILGLGTWLWLGQGGFRSVPESVGGLRMALFGLSVGFGLLLALYALRHKRTEAAALPDWPAWLTFWVLSLGAVALQQDPGPVFWLIWLAAMAVGPISVGGLCRILARRSSLMPESMGAALILVLVVGNFLLLFPPSTWHHIVFADDYGIVYYNTIRDLEAYRAGGLFGWDPQVEGGRNLVLNLRSLAPLVAPLLWLGREVAFHVVYFVAYLAFPLLVGLLVRTSLKSRGRDTARAGFLWGLFTGGLLLLTFTTNLYRFGMIYSMVAVDLLLVQLWMLDLIFRGRRLGAVGLGLAVGLGVYVHLAHLAMGLVFLVIVCLHRTLRSRRFPPLDRLAGAALVAAGVALPFLATLWMQGDSITSQYLMGVSPVLLALQKAGPLDAARLLVDQILWEFPGYFRLLVLCLPLLGLAMSTRGTRFGGLVWIGVLLTASVFLAWIPTWGYSMLRLHLLIPVVLAPLAAEALRQTTGLGRGAVLTGLALVFGFYPGMDWWPSPHYSGPSLQTEEGGLVGVVRDLPGHRVLFENSAGQRPLKDLTRTFDVYPGNQVQRAGPLALATGRDLFAHAGWDPYAYHVLRDAFIVNGAYQGDRLAEMDEAGFEAALKRYGVEGMVVWSEGAKEFLRARPDRYDYMFKIPGQSDPVQVPSYTVFHYRHGDARAVRMDAGEATVFHRGSFGYGVDVRGARKGGTLRISARYLPGWTAFTEEGDRLEVMDLDGLLGVRMPRKGIHRVWFSFQRRRKDLLGAGGVLIFGMVLCLGRRRGSRPRTGKA